MNKKRVVGADSMIQTRVPREVYEWVNKQAEEEGDSTAGWLRRLLIRVHKHGLTNLEDLQIRITRLETSVLKPESNIKLEPCERYIAPFRDRFRACQLCGYGEKFHGLKES